MAGNRGVTRPANVPSPGKTHAHQAKGGYITGTVGTTPTMVGTGGIKTAAHGQNGGLILPGGAMQTRGGKAQSNKKAG